MLRRLGIGTRARRLSLILLSFASLVQGIEARTPAFEYRRYRLFEMVAIADAVVTGEIVALQGKTYDFEVKEWVVGAGPPTIRVDRFKNWTCASRWSAYAIGQRAMLFLVSSRADDRYSAIGSGDEGDMPLLADRVLPSYRVHGYPAETIQIEGKEVWGTQIPIDEFMDAVRGFRATLASSGKGRERAPFARIEPRDDLSTAGTFATTSRTAMHLFEEALSSPAWPHDVPATVQKAGSLTKIAPKASGMAGEARLARGRDPGRFRSRLEPWFAASCAVLGDLDRDGIDELVAGAPSDCYLGDFRGALWVLFLNEKGQLTGKAEISENAGGLELPLNDDSRFGTAVAPLGDLNGDGTPDVLVSAPGWDEVGGLWVLFLDRSGHVIARRSVLTDDVLASADADPKDLAASSGLGFSVGSAACTLGDLEGDGSIEVAVTLERGWDGWVRLGNSVIVLSIGKDGDVRWATAIGEGGRWSERALWFADALCSPGDLDGDGVAELAVGHSGIPDGGEYRGAVRIFFLNRNGSVRREQRISDWEGGFEGLLFDDDQFGQALAAPGDVDQDGTADLLVADERGLWLLYLTPRGTVRAHREIRDSRQGFTDVGSFRRSLACTTGWDSDGTIRLLAGGTAGSETGGEQVLWLLRLRRDGTVSPW